MVSLTIKKLSDEIMARLRDRAARDRRSLNMEVIHLLELALAASDEGAQRASEAQQQADAWSRLAGRWVSEQTAEQDARDLFDARSAGRDVDL